MDDFNAALMDLVDKETPFWKAHAENLYLLFDGAGTILKIWNRDFSKRSDLLPYFKKTNNIRDVFQIPEGCDFFTDTAFYFILRHDRGIVETLDNFITDMPLYRLHVARLRDGRFLGNISHSTLLPEMQYPDASMLLFTDLDERIRGYTVNLAAALLAPGENPRGLLGARFSEVLTPGIVEIQQSYLRKMARRAGEWTGTLYEWHAGAAFDLGAFHPDNVRSDERGLEWTNSGEDDDFISLPPVLDLSRHDFNFHVELAETTRSPLLVIGTRVSLSTDHYPDSNGYLASYFPEPDSAHCLKKHGYLSVMEKGAPLKGPGSFTLEKRGRSLRWLRDDKCVLEYYDPDFTLLKNAVFSLGLNAGGKALFTKIRIRYGRTIDESHASPLLVHTRKAPERHFTLNRFQNNALASKGEFQGYILNDISQFQARTDRFQQYYLEEKEKREKIRLLLDEKPGNPSLLIGKSRSMQRIREQAAAVSASKAAVLIQGPTGTGKGVLARYLHALGPGKNKPFVTVDCSAIPAALMESELFGYEPGAFTGATGRKSGRFEEADGGTLFLDEIGNLNPSIQAKLLGVLQEFTITRVGGLQPIPLDIRVIAASNVDLAVLIRQNLFREDLYYRINAVTLFLPPLKERTEDIPELCTSFIREFSASLRKKIKGLTPKAYQRLYGHIWPGNVRELKNVIHKAAIFCDREWITPDLIQFEPRDVSAISDRAPKGRLRKITRLQFKALIKKHRGCVIDMARELGVTRQACYWKLKKWRMDPDRYKSE